MLGKAIPSRTRRGWGRASVALSAIAVGYAAWAAEPASQVAELAGSQAGPVHLLGVVSVTSVDDQHYLVGVASRAGGRIDHLFLYTSQAPGSTRLRLNTVPLSRLDYDPDGGLRFTFLNANPQTDSKNRFELVLGGRGALSSIRTSHSVNGVPEGPGSPARIPLGVSLGVLHYVVQPALSDHEFWKLQRTDDCGGEEPPCILQGTQALRFP